MNWTVWSRRFLTGLAMVGLVGFTFADPVATTFTFPTTVPEGWTDRTVPTTAEQVTLSGTNFELENVATDGSAYKQTLGNYTANVAEIVGNTGTACEIFGLHGQSSGSRKTAEHDIWLKVSGGTYSYVIGGAENWWQSSKATFLKGNIFLELAGGTVSNDLIGVLDKGGVGLDKQSATVLTGNAMVVVSGGTVTGNVVGGVASQHNATPVIEGDTLVRILTVLSGSNRVYGGSFYRDNANSSAKHNGNTAVEVELADETAESTFTKEIIGGSYGKSGANFAISKNTSVSITAPNTVTFSSPIYGASYAASTSTTTTVGGTSSVTINGGKFTSKIYAAGYGTQTKVTGKATLTLKAGVFSGATLGVGNNGSTAGSSELVIAGTIDLSSATVNDDFGALTLQGDLNLGTNRLSSATLSVDTTSTRTLTITISEDEKNNNLVTLGKVSGTAVPEGLTISATDSEGTEVKDWSLSVKDGALIYAPRSSSHTWSTPESGTAWADGLPNFQNGDSVTFGTNTNQETVTLPTSGARVEDLVVNGNYAFGGSAGRLSATTATIAEGATLACNISVNALRLTPSGASGGDAQNALSEFILTLSGSPVAWPTGTTIAQRASDGTMTEAAWTNNEEINALIDGVYGSSTSASAPINPKTGDSCTYSKPGGYIQTNYNKWWAKSAGASAVITLGSAVPFDGYILWASDSASRNPKAWTLEGSTDGGNTWVTLDSRSGISSPGTNVAYNSGSPYASGVALAVTKDLTVNGTLSSSYRITAGTATFGAKGVLAGAPTLEAETITFETGSTIKVPASGVATLVGKVDGTVVINLDALPIPALATPFPVLKAPEGLELTLPDGYALSTYADGCYRLYRKPPVWTAGSDNNTWSNRNRWAGLAEGDSIPTSGSVEINFSTGETATLTVDAAVKLDALLVSGTSAGVITVDADGSLALDALTAETDVTLPTSLLPASVTILAGKTLTLSGDGTLSNAFTTAGTLALADGTVTLAEGVDLSSLTGITIGSGATLDFNGISRQSDAFTLAGGTIKNSSSTSVAVGPVTLTADSFVDTTEGEVQFNAANNNRKDLLLKGYKLTKTGSNLFQVCGADVDSGTIRIEEGAFRLAKSGSDSTLTNTTLSFAEGTSYSLADHWIQSSTGTVTLDADSGAEIDFGTVYLTGNFALKKTGEGTVTVSSNGNIWSSTTTVSGGTLVLNTTADFAKNNTITIEDGATFKKTGTNKLTFNAAPSGKGTIEVAAGTIKQAAVACGGFQGLYKIDSGATLDAVDNYNYHPFMSTSGGKGIVLDGTLKVSTGSCALTGCSITGTGSIEISKYSTQNSITLTCPTTITGALKIASGVEVKGITVNDKTGAVEKKLVLSGPDVVCNGTLSGADASITIAKGKTLSGTGSIAGAVTLSDGSTLNASTATDSSRLTFSGTAGSVTAGGNVSVVLPTSPASGLQLVEWKSAPADTTYTATTTLSALAFLHAKTDGLYYDVMSIVDGGGTAGSDGSIEALSDAAKHALAKAAFDADVGATSIKSVTGTQGGADLSATAIDGALTCFALTPTVVDVTDGAATITVAYDFGISGMSAVMENKVPQVTVKAKVENKTETGSAAAFLTEGAEIILQSKDKTADETAWAQVVGATFTADGDIYKATVSLSDVSNKVFRVLARTKAAE